MSTAHLHAALRHPTDPHILLLPNGNGWQLPYARHPEDFWYADVPIVNKVFGAMFNTPLWDPAPVPLCVRRNEKTRHCYP
ncbi:MAG: hypothetical protein Fur0022_28500 [Anaerolineales bacterium]